jgi:ribose 5-phosphate isomerase RpiB
MNQLSPTKKIMDGEHLAWELVQTFLAARFSGAERHCRRLAKGACLEAEGRNQPA